ncbi:clathrin light chain [Lineolata rhizophorae]|uniref:Clathrin light chain n=1 Tax=Lineolata rhizophorae TaxID=578093 RepID=A0A6A6NRD3_9PEZI|nr:clathrin light chain [Lineolata rhizophorae]
MADRFPSLDEIDAGQTTTRGDATNFDLIGGGGGGGDGPGDASDFLSRERAALGDDANQFASPGDSRLATTVEDAPDGDLDDDLLGGGGTVGGDGAAQEEMRGFEESFPAIDAGNEHMAPGGTITGTNAPYLPGAAAASSSFAPAPMGTPEPEPEVIRAWRERRDLAIKHRDEVSANRKAETIKAAHEAIDDFYDNYNNRKEKGIAQTRREADEFLAAREDTAAGGTSWERIAKLVDLSGKGTKGGGSGSDKARFRELLLSLRKDQNAPGAEGY